MAGVWSGNALLRIIVISIGNAVGGIAFAEIRRYIEGKKA